MLSPQLKAIAVSLGGLVALCVITSNNGITSTLEKAHKEKAKGVSDVKELEVLMEEAEKAPDTMQRLVSSIHTIATLKAKGHDTHPLMNKAHAVRQSAMGSMGYH